MSDGDTTNKPQLLVESFFQAFDVVSDPYTVTVNESTGEITEKKTGEGPMIIRGIFQYENKRNNNKRIYPTGLWESHLKDDSDLMTRVKQRRAIGEVEHPENGVGHTLRSAILVTSLTLGKPDADGARAVIGEAEVLPTPNGRIVRDLLRSKVMLGISSRGRGSIRENGIVDAKTFVPETWDIVGNPSTPGAFPNVVDGRLGESIVEDATLKTFKRNGRLEWQAHGVKYAEAILESNNKKKTGGSMSRQQMDAIRRLSESAMALPLTESVESLLKTDQVLENATIELATLSEADSTLVPAINVLQERVASHRKLLDEACKSKKNMKKPFKKKDEEDVEEEADVEEEDSIGEGEEDATAPEITPAKTRALLKLSHDKLGEAQTRINELEEKLAEADATNSEIATVLTERDEEIVRERALRATATALIQRITIPASPVAESVKNAVAEAVESNPDLESIRTLLERCETPDEVRAHVSMFGTNSRSNGSTTRKLPPVTEKTKSSDDQLDESTTGAAKPKPNTRLDEDGDEIPRGARMAQNIHERRIAGQRKPVLNETQQANQKKN